MKTYTVTLMTDENEFKVFHIKANNTIDAVSKAEDKMSGETWLASVFEGKHKDLSRETF